MNDLIRSGLETTDGKYESELLSLEVQEPQIETHNVNTNYFDFSLSNTSGTVKQRFFVMSFVSRRVKPERLREATSLQTTQVNLSEKEVEEVRELCDLDKCRNPCFDWLIVSMDKLRDRLNGTRRCSFNDDKMKYDIVKQTLNTTYDKY